MHFTSSGPVSNVSFLGLRETFSHKRRTHCSWQEPALPPPRPPRTWKPPFLPMDHRHSFLHPQSLPGKGSGPKPWPAGSGRSFSWKSTSSLSACWFLFLGESFLALLYHTALFFFNYYLIFCAHLHFLSLAPKSCLLCFLPHRGRESHLASRFVKLLSKCRFFPVPPYFSQSASLPGFVKLLYAGKLVYEICFFFANRTFHLLLLESFCV